MTCNGNTRRHIPHKIFSVFFVLLAFNSFTNAQITIAVAPAKMNVFYIGVDNPVNIAASAASDEKISVSISGGGGSITKIGSGRYIVRVNVVTDECVISVLANGKIAGTSSFRVRELPDVIATVGGHSSGDTMPASVFKEQDGVSLSTKDFPFETHFEITSFTLTMDGDQESIHSFNCQGSSFSPMAKQSILQNIKPGSVVTIEDIRVLGPDNRNRKIAPLVYYIK